MASQNQRQGVMYNEPRDETLILEHSPPLPDALADNGGGLDADADKGIPFTDGLSGGERLAVPVGSTMQQQAAGQSDLDWQPPFVDAKGKAVSADTTGQAVGAGAVRGTTADVINGIGT